MEFLVAVLFIALGAAMFRIRRLTKMIEPMQRQLHEVTTHVALLPR